jgi:outer membrane protein OmpA-like peptidoglycan-associated protein
MIGGKNIAFTALRAYNFSEKSPLWEFLPPFPGAGTQPVASGGTLYLPAGNYLYAVGTYYEKPIVYGNDGNSYLMPEEESSSSSSEILFSVPASSSSSMETVVTASAGSSSGLLNASSASSTSSVIPANILQSSQGPLPQAKPVNLEATSKGESVVVNNIYFEFDRAYLRRESIRTLNDIVSQLKKNPRIKLEIQGHTDNIGTIEYNKKLSERRADAVMEYLIKNGISPERLRSLGFGATKPVADNSTEAGRSKNRRTEFLILEK